MAVGDEVSIQTDSYPDVFHGRISYVAASLDPNTRTLQAHIETANPEHKLKKDMYVVASVDAGTIHNAIAVPDAAVLRDSENQPFVYVETEGNQFGMRSISVGESLKGETEVTAGLKPAMASSETAACSCNSRTPCNVSRSAFPTLWHPRLHDPSNRTSGASSALPGVGADPFHDGRWNHLIPAHASRCLSRSFASPSRAHHAMPATPPRK